MSIIEIDTTINFEFIEENFYDLRGISLQGSTRSSKTIAIIQWIILYCLQNTGKEIVICRDTLTNLKRTTLKDFQALCYGLGDYFPIAPNMQLNKSELIAKINGNSITFIGLLDDPMRVYGLKSDIFYINEAVSTHKHTFLQLNQRCKEGWLLDFNPSEPNSWVYQLEKRDDVKMFRTTFEDNPFLEDEIVNQIRGYEPTKENIEQGTADERMWSIYGKGEIYKGPEIVYPNWNTFTDYPNGYDWKLYGLDWGWTHPLAVVEVVCKGNDLYWKQIIYQTELELDDLVDKMKQNEGIMSGECYVVCDSAEPRSINRLVSAGIPAIKADKKGGSVMSGIRKVQSMNLHIHEDSHDLQNEANNYKFKIDSRSDTVLEIPVKEHDDGMDAGRYPTDMFAE